MKFTAEVAPIGINATYAPARRGNRMGIGKTDKARAYQARIQLAAGLAMLRSPGEQSIGGRTEPFLVPVEVTLAFFWPTMAGDVDAPVKATLDAMQGYVYANDSQVVALHVTRAKDAARPRVEVEITPAIEAQTGADFGAILGPKPRAKLARLKLRSSVRRVP